VTRADLNSSAWRRTRRRFLERWVAMHGRVCAGWQRPPHFAWPLQVDHVEPRSLARGLQALCPECNNHKQDTRPKPKPRTRAEIHEETRR
jgi:hypothetical protein